MPWRNTAEQWGKVAKTLHWSVAFVILLTLGIGLVMDTQTFNRFHLLLENLL